MDNSVIQEIERHYGQVFDYIMAIVGDRFVADDILQDTVIKMLHFIEEGRYTDNGKFIVWMRSIAHNKMIDHFRRIKQLKYINESNEGRILSRLRLSDPTVEERLGNEQICLEVRRMIDNLPDNQRQVVILRYYMEKSFSEISEQTGVSINTALARMRYALINLRKMADEKNLYQAIL